MMTDDHNTPALDAAHLAVVRARLEAERVRLHGILQGLDAEVRDSAADGDVMQVALIERGGRRSGTRLRHDGTLTL